MSHSYGTTSSNVLRVRALVLFISYSIRSKIYTALVIFLGIPNQKASQKKRCVSSSVDLYDLYDLSVASTGKKGRSAATKTFTRALCENIICGGRLC